MEIVKKVSDIDFKKLIDKGYNFFIFDFDNTINLWKKEEIPEEIAKIFKFLFQNNSKILIVSNGKPRILNFSVETLWLAKKPLPFKFLRYIHKKYGNMKFNFVIIGDQLFTDMLFGVFINAYRIKIEPIDTSHEFFITKILRKFEKILLKFLKHMI
ncbi:haloacid dehalogenase [Thermosipho melanesiensis]|uniref:Hydrolase of the HAD superfamily-like protein n=2 Tax=Thermosipho melanesiensis TaxID=46541 RepID=A6LMT5_THEM4|nr:haloacid dehalogenase [Thermosipho melanesiensis]ABR31236.1 hydrolase of the HAD superfamily-like protein [Thermosipho melanesiensis BI429]APT74320.1 haloacid dehalogenase [Thermosipho melanesiensis]OOC36261.1 haloacid dehalogenase [Thermosipho melanesiensis]OOC37079.1 haloacid dehalogenase [Thermosipho melanesiensis]OOC37831.1 haloacid dehalogenase [Thermosipho melanesiensis]